MGNEMSNSQDDKKKPLNEDVAMNTEILPSFFAKEQESSYNGLKTLNGTEKDHQKSTSSSQTTDKTSEAPYHDIRVPTLFEWNEGGSIAYVTGSFSNWSQWFIMSKKQNGNYELTLELPKGIHQYKFIIDNIWTCSNNHPTVNDDKGNLNNIIDNTKYERPREKVKKHWSKAEKKNGIANGKKASPSKDYYDYIPKKNELNTEAPIIPNYYSRSYCLDKSTIQYHIGNLDYMTNFEKTFTSENTSFTRITEPPHVNM